MPVTGMGSRGYSDPDDWKTEEEREEDKKIISSGNNSFGGYMFLLAFLIFVGIILYEIIRYKLS